MKKKTQRKIIEEKLRTDGEVTNVWAIEHYMLRLGDIIHRMRKDGWEIDGDFIEGTKNFRYTLVKDIKRTQVIEQLPNGHVRESFV